MKAEDLAAEPRPVLGPRVNQKFGGLTLRVFEDFRRSVVFFGKQSPPDGQIKYGGTGFLLIDDFEGDLVPLVVTARHVAKQLEEDFFVRINKHGGESIALPVANATWCHHPDKNVDLSALIHIFNPKIYDCTYFSTAIIMPYSPTEIFCGDTVSLVGLFRLRAGSKRNVPIVHTGHIASVPDPNEKIPLTDRVTGLPIEVASYLIEAQTFDGLSGSPVLYYERTRERNKRSSSRRLPGIMGW